MAVCIYCGFNHADNDCPQRYESPVDIFGLMKFTYKKRSSPAECIFCGELIEPDCVYGKQIKRIKGTPVKTVSFHLGCYLSEVESAVFQYQEYKTFKKEEAKEKNRANARERYRRCK